MLDRAVAAPRADKVEALEGFNAGTDGFRARDFTPSASMSEPASTPSIRRRGASRSSTPTTARVTPTAKPSCAAVASRARWMKWLPLSRARRAAGRCRKPRMSPQSATGSAVSGTINKPGNKPGSGRRAGVWDAPDRGVVPSPASGVGVPGPDAFAPGVRSWPKPLGPGPLGLEEPVRRPDPSVPSPRCFAVVADGGEFTAAGHALGPARFALSPEMERAAVLASPGGPA